ncbi:hypothetical protein [Paucibacter sp. Y2R2-4]|uniref:hypothetical protein n=1 Tax=Paucibacter sp. Y2R2-4 TaxID=2893553 RepID=UPI0021E36411|nr:hypothetical protein [Paucibacter sp. Y2R2-4]MCV2351990.1 hypothetical protein [Paucibacter sp. Y2R2-4]
MHTDPTPGITEALDNAADAEFGPPRFGLGLIVATNAACNFFNRHGINAMEYLRLHVRGQWGDVPPEDARANDEAIKNGGRILSSYRMEGRTVWIITEAVTESEAADNHRESTCLLFPSEY